MVSSFGPARDAPDEEEPDGREVGSEWAACAALAGDAAQASTGAEASALQTLPTRPHSEIPARTQRGSRTPSLRPTPTVALKQFLVGRAQRDADDGTCEHHRRRDLAVRGL